MSAISATSSASSLVNAQRLSVTGLATGLDTDSIIKGLLAIDQGKIDKLNADISAAQKKQTAFKGIEARLLTLQTDIITLSRSQNGVFDLRTITSSDEDLITAAASSSAAPGFYQLRAQALAQTHQIASQGFTSASAAITQGTIQIKASGAPMTTITIDGSNNTLQGLASAINDADAGVTAMIVNDGSSAESYRLLLKSDTTGTANGITLVNGLAADSGLMKKVVFDAASVGAAQLATGYSGSSTPTSNAGGVFTGTANNTYTFTVLSGGTVGTDDNLQVAYTDIDGTHTGTLTIDAGDVGNPLAVAEGIEVSFSAGAITAGQQFTIKGYVPLVQAASDAVVSIGSGSGALTVRSATNQFDEVLPGVSIDLKGADPAKFVSLTVDRDIEQAKDAITDFISAYNDLMKYIDDQVSFDATSQRAGILLGARQATTVQDQIRTAMQNPVAGLKPQMNRLGALGITTNDQGRLVVNDQKLDDALEGRLVGVTLDDVRRLFAMSGTSTHAAITFVNGSTRTKASAMPYTVTVTQAAEQAAVQGASPLASLTTLNSGNNVLQIAVDGASAASVTLAPGSYSRLALAQELEAQINASPTLAGRRVSVGLAGDLLTITSATFGSNSKIAISGGTALAALGFLGTENVVGGDAAGYFTVNGEQESAIGSGQFLVGAATNAHTADLQIRVGLTPAQVDLDGVSANIAVSRGIASAVGLSLSSLLDPISGRMHTVDDSFDDSITDIQAAVARQTELMSAHRDSLLKQFAALESTVSQLQGLSNFLATQSSQLSTFGSNSTNRT